MPLTARTPMTADEFLSWAQGQERRHELVGGVPVAMAGARRRHDQIVVNALGELRSQLRGGTCRPFSADTAVRIPNGNVRLPDAGVDCGRFDDEATASDQPALVIEVLSASTRDFDLFRKLEEYKTVPSLAHILIVNPDEPEAGHWTRAGDGTWSHQTHEGIEATVVVAHPALSLRFSDLYEGLSFHPRPRLVAGD